MSDPILTGVLCVCLFLLAISAVEHYFRQSIIPTLCWVMIANTAGMQFYLKRATLPQD